MKETREFVITIVLNQLCRVTRLFILLSNNITSHGDACIRCVNYFYDLYQVKVEMLLLKPFQ